MATVIIPNFVFVFTIKDIKYIKWDFHSVAWVMSKGWDLKVLGEQTLFFSKHGRMAYKIEGDCE